MSEPIINPYTEILAALDTAIKDYAVSGGQRTTTVGGVSFAYASLDELLKLKNHYAQLSEIWEARHSGKGVIRRKRYRISAV